MKILNDNNIKIKLWLLILTLGFAACKKTTETFDNPYAGGKAALGIVFNNANLPVPALGAAGTEVVFQVSGLLTYRDKAVFYFNGQQAEILEITATTIKVKVPLTGSTGAASLAIGDQVFFGPQFTVLGKITADPFFKPLNGANGAINDYYKLSDGRLIMVGAFTNYDNKGIVLPNNRIALTTKEGDLDRSFKFGTGANGTLSAVTAAVNDAYFFVGGNFHSFDKLGRIENITRLLPNGAIDSINTSVYSTPISGKKLGISAFNGGTNGPIVRLFQFQNKIIAVGNFSQYVTRRYNVGRTYINKSGATVLVDSIAIDSIQSNQVMKFNLDGSMDKTYRFDLAANKSLAGGNGYIDDAFMQADGKVILVGAFSRFDNNAYGHIVRLNTDGTVDNTFNAGGSGANSNLYSITYNSINQKFLIAGLFGTYNGSPVQGLAQLNPDGTIDNSFTALDFDSGFPTYAKQLNNGLIVVNGSFVKYGGVKRRSLVFLTATGALAPGYNSTGEFSGSINRIFELQNQDNKRALILMGSFNKYDSLPVANIIGVVVAD